MSSIGRTNVENDRLEETKITADSRGQSPLSYAVDKISELEVKVQEYADELKDANMTIGGQSFEIRVLTYELAKSSNDMVSLGHRVRMEQAGVATRDEEIRVLMSDLSESRNDVLALESKLRQSMEGVACIRDKLRISDKELGAANVNFIKLKERLKECEDGRNETITSKDADIQVLTYELAKSRDDVATLERKNHELMEATMTKDLELGLHRLTKRV